MLAHSLFDRMKRIVRPVLAHVMPVACSSMAAGPSFTINVTQSKGKESLRHHGLTTGEIKLNAAADDLAPPAAIVHTQPCPPRPSVP